MDLDKFLAEKETMTENDIVVIKFPIGDVDLNIGTISSIAKMITEKMGEKRVVFIPKQFDEEVIEKDSLINLLKKQLERLE